MGNCCCRGDDQAIENADGKLNDKYDNTLNDEGDDSVKEQTTEPLFSSQFGDEKPKPLIFAVLRNGHEVIRSAMEDISEELSVQISRGDSANVDKLVEMWNDLHAWQGMHTLMKEGKGLKGYPKTSPLGFFEILDRKFDDIATKNGLYDAYGQLSLLEAAMHNACHLKDILKIKEAWKNFEEFNSENLKKEESITIPKVVEMKKSGEKNLKQIMKDEIFAMIAESPDLKFFIQYANHILDTHPGGMPRARVFDHSLWAIAEPHQWSLWVEWIEASLTKARFVEVQAAIYPEEESPKLYAPDVPQYTPYVEATNGDEAEC